MRIRGRGSEPDRAGTDRYDELMARHEALGAEIRRRIHAFVAEMQARQPMSSVGARTDGIRLAMDGSLDAIVEFTDSEGRIEEVVLRADPGGEVFEFHGRPAEPDQSRPAASADESAERLEAVAALARSHLPAAAAEEFLGQLRPALRLVRAGEGDAVIAQLGGLPTLPINSWPVWHEHGPLSHVLSFDCAPVAALLPELPLPRDGRLAFFYFDGHFDDFASTVGSWEPATQAGARVLHLHPERSSRADITDAATPAPPGIKPFPAVPLTAVRTVTWPSYETPAMQALWAKHDLAGRRDGGPVNALYDALWELPGGGYDTHQIGGHPCPQQGPVELEVEQARRGLAAEPFDWSDPAVQAAASDWQLLLQVASEDDADMMWGDVGQLYYLTPAGGRPEQSLFTWQCG